MALAAARHAGNACESTGGECVVAPRLRGLAAQAAALDWQPGPSPEESARVRRVP